MVPSAHADMGVLLRYAAAIGFGMLLVVAYQQYAPDSGLLPEFEFPRLSPQTYEECIDEVDQDEAERTREVDRQNARMFYGEIQSVDEAIRIQDDLDKRRSDIQKKQAECQTLTPATPNSFG